ncbi:Bro1 domain-containing protein brox-like [Plakobranchus ocellatus]|uniref:Bro1 domain-containing protein brox-like n=1 Tax=Plakobranchus ocellatus TaxID=259542 RepID=A0AAV4A7E1_9GAST|nr:Bro1 domain-containing protein brox-like [Plakobranchus ocellatus]
MAYWFHRNPLKATAPVNYELHGVSTNEKTRKIFSDLRLTRSKLLEMLTDPNHSRDAMEKVSSDYLSLLLGLCIPMEQNESENKLRKLIKFKWTNTLQGNVPIEATDTGFEFFSILFNVALWFTKHAAKIAAKDDPDMEEAKEIHKCLRIAAGMFTFCKDDLRSKLVDPPTEGAHDTDSRILEAYIHQCTAEAQEITLARAVELKHAVGLIAALAYETAVIYQKGDDALASLDQKDVGKWRKYFQLKNKFYLSCAHSYNGEDLLSQDKCGEAIRGLRESVELYGSAELLCREYGQSKGAGTTAKPQNHLFFRKLGPVVKRTLEKCERENGLIYHQKVAFDAPLLELRATYGLVSPEEYKAPTLNQLWSPDVYNQFSTANIPKPPADKGGKGESPAPLPSVKEKEVPMSDKDPKNNSGCIVS